jgi:fructuronate reductase
MTPPLSRAGLGRPAAPVRLLHLGLGNFCRAHQAWYTEHAPDRDAWGMAAFTVRSPAMADALKPQDGLFTLVTRGPSGNSAEVIGTLSAVHTMAEHAAWLDYWRRPEVALLTVTITEGGYLAAPGGGLDTGLPAVQTDLAALRADPLAPVATAPARIAAGLLARRAAGDFPVTLLPCDNLPDNGPRLAAVVADVLAAVDPAAAAWVGAHAAFATTVVDRITPVTTDQTRADALALTGYADAAPVGTEPFSEWVIQGDFPAGRPAWEESGARFVPDVRPFERRKLTLLNGAHSLMAYAAPILGIPTVDGAIADPAVRAWVDQWWDEAVDHLELPPADLAAYRADLVERFSNPGMRDFLARIAADGSTKLPIRIVPTLRAELAAGRVPPGACRALAAWALHLRGLGAPVKDVQPALAEKLAEGTLADTVARVVAYLGDDLAANPAVAAEVTARAEEILAARPV